MELVPQAAAQEVLEVYKKGEFEAELQLEHWAALLIIAQVKQFVSIVVHILHV